MEPYSDAGPGKSWGNEWLGLGSQLTKVLSDQLAAEKWRSATSPKPRGGLRPETGTCIPGPPATVLSPARPPPGQSCGKRCSGTRVPTQGPGMRQDARMPGARPAPTPQPSGLGDSAAAGTSSAGTSRSPWRSSDTPRPRCAAQNRAGTDRVPGTWEDGSRCQDGGPTACQGQRPQQDRKSPPPTLGLFA